MDPPSVAKLVPGETGMNHPVGTIFSKIFLIVIPASQVIKPFILSKWIILSKKLD